MIRSAHKKITLSLLALLLAFSPPLSAQTKLGAGEQPQLTVDGKGNVRLVYGQGNKIFFATSTDGGATFTDRQLVGEVEQMHLGMSRGPQLATSSKFSLVTAMNKAGDIISFVLDHRTGKWEKTKNVNDAAGSAPEGLVSVSADENNRFFAVWLDLRADRKNNICFAIFENGKWSANRFIYRSPGGSVCECCKPTVMVRGQTVVVMFRNSLEGARDMYMIKSTDGGNKFSDAQKLGEGTWPLKACPMDGGGVSFDSKNQIHTAWQRDGSVFHCVAGLKEERIAAGRNVGIANEFVTWQNGSDLFIKRFGGEERKIGQGTGLQLVRVSDHSLLCLWEQGDEVVSKVVGF